MTSPPRLGVPGAGRHRRRRLGERPRAEHLVDGGVADLEAVAGSAQVQAPDPQALGAGEPLRLLEVLIEALGPVAKRLRVVGVEVLDVEGLEPRPLERREHPGEVEQLAVGEDVAVRELAADVDAVLLGGDPDDPVVEYPAVGLQYPLDLAAVLVDLGLADVLDHPDARDGVEAVIGEVAIVGYPDLDQVADPGFPRPLGGELGLRRRKGDPERRDAVLAGGVDHEAAPAAADVEHPLAGLELQFPTDQLELRLLRFLQGLGPLLEQGAAVGHRLVEEECEEIVRDVVVVTHRLGVAPLAVPGAPRPQLCRGRLGKPAQPGGTQRRCSKAQLGERAQGWRLPAAEQGDDAVEVVDVHLAGDVGAPEPELARGPEEVPESVRGAEGDRRARAGRLHLVAVPEAQLERAIGKGALDRATERCGRPCGDDRQPTASERAFRSRRARGIGCPRWPATPASSRSSGAPG